MSDLRVEPARVQHTIQTAASVNHSGPASSTAGSALSSAAAVAGSGGGTASSVRPIPPITHATATTASQPELTNRPGSNRHDTRSIRIAGSVKRARGCAADDGHSVRFVSPTRLIQPLGGDDPSVLGPLRDRRVYRLYGAFEIHPDEEQDERDFRESVAKWWEGWQERNDNNKFLKAKLQAGMFVMCRMSGGSMLPLVHHKDVCLFEPVLNSDTIKEGDIVFCEIQPSNKFAAHKVLKIYEETNIRYYDIGDKRGCKHGWCQGQHIYGRLIEVRCGE